MIQFIKLIRDARDPIKSSLQAAGWDLFSAEEKFLEKGERALVSTGIAISLPFDTCGKIEDRSGLALNHGLKTMGGVIDADYRGEIKIIMVNLGDKGFQIKKHDKIAQLLVLQLNMDNFVKVRSLDATQRNTDGFGSTGR